MLIAGYGIYNLKNNEKSQYAFSALGIVKIIDIVLAYFVGPSYDFYNLEKERTFKDISFKMGVNSSETDEMLDLMVSYHF